jgi:hypothetical protein
MHKDVYVKLALPYIYYKTHRKTKGPDPMKHRRIALTLEHSKAHQVRYNKLEAQPNDIYVLNNISQEVQHKSTQGWQ